jgi:hypothetical protein
LELYVQLLEELSILVDNPIREENKQPLISDYYKEITPLGHVIQSWNCPLPPTTHTKASSTKTGYLATREDKNKESRGSQR